MRYRLLGKAKPIRRERGESRGRAAELSKLQRCDGEHTEEAPRVF